MIANPKLFHHISAKLAACPSLRLRHVCLHHIAQFVLATQHLQMQRVHETCKAGLWPIVHFSYTALTNEVCSLAWDKTWRTPKGLSPPRLTTHSADTDLHGAKWNSVLLSIPDMMFLLFPQKRTCSSQKRNPTFFQ